MRVQRVSTAIWQCGRCGVKIAGAAYVPSMPIAKPLEKKIEVEGKAKEGS
jgi:ribosomal protein L37AE/L43A